MNTVRISDCWVAGSDDPYCTFARENFNYAVAENAMKWTYYEPEYDVFQTFAVDNLMEWLAFNNFGFRYMLARFSFLPCLRVPCCNGTAAFIEY